MDHATVELTENRYIGNRCQRCHGTVRYKRSSKCAFCARKYCREYCREYFTSITMRESRKARVRKNARVNATKDLASFRFKTACALYAQRNKKYYGRPGCDITPQWLQEKYNKVCEISGIPFAPLKANISDGALSVGQHERAFNTFSVDRIDASKGYSKDNCRAVLLCVNTGMSHYSLVALIPVLVALEAPESTTIEAVPALECKRKRRMIQQRLSDVRVRSRRKQFSDTDLDYDWVLKRSHNCSVTGIPFSTTISARAENGGLVMSVDRLNSSLGYTKDNCRVILNCLNNFIGPWGLETVRPVAKAIVERYNQGLLTIPPSLPTPLPSLS